MNNIKFKIDNGIYELDLIKRELNYTGLMSASVKEICKTIENIVALHAFDKLHVSRVILLKNEIKEKIQNQGYRFDFIEG